MSTSNPAPPLALPPASPHWAVIFTSQRTQVDEPGYAQAAGEMMRLAQLQPGFLGAESARGSDGLGITVSYWRSEEAIRAWKGVADHLAVQRMGRERWYSAYTLRVARVERSYTLETSPRTGLEEGR